MFGASEEHPHVRANIDAKTSSRDSLNNHNKGLTPKELRQQPWIISLMAGNQARLHPTCLPVPGR